MFDQMAQVGFFGHNTVTYKNGQLVPGRGWQILFKAMKDSYHSYILNIRQKYSEDLLRMNYESFGYEVQYGWEVVQYDMDSSLGDGCNISVRIKHAETQEEKTVRWSVSITNEDWNEYSQLRQQIFGWCRWWALKDPPTV